MIIASLVCAATIFGYPGDGHGGRTPTLLTGEPVKATDVGIAHRRWPVGALVVVQSIRTGRAAIAVVIDRGPYGKISPDGQWFNARKHRKRPGRFRGCVDMTPKLGSLIGFKKRGRGKVRVTLVWKGWK